MSQLKNIKLATPTYKEIIPSTKKEVTISPFKVGDEKVLLIASESKDVVQMVSSLKTVINNCVEGEVVENLSSFDVEYLFLKIRAVSVGETANLMLACKECETANEFSVDLSALEVRGIEDFNKNVKLTDDLAFEMSTPDIETLAKADSSPESIINFVAANVKNVFYGEETIEVTPDQVEDVVDIINQLTAAQFSDLQKYILSIPKVSYDVEFDCKHCEAKNQNTLEGLSDFF